MAVLGRSGVMLCEQSSGKPMNQTALGLVGEREELVTREVSRMCGDQIKKASFLIVVAEINEGCEMFRADGHSDRMSDTISGSGMAGRRGAASSGSAYIANPVWALATKPCALMVVGN